MDSRWNAKIWRSCTFSTSLNPEKQVQSTCFGSFEWSPFDIERSVHNYFFRIEHLPFIVFLIEVGIMPDLPALHTALPAPMSNATMIFVFILLMFWFLKAFRRFGRSVLLRYSLLHENIVHIRGIGSYLHFFEGATRAHLQSVIQTRQSKPAVPMAMIGVPCHLHTISLVPNPSRSRRCMMIPNASRSVRGWEHGWRCTRWGRSRWRRMRKRMTTTPVTHHRLKTSSLKLKQDEETSIDFNINLYFKCTWSRMNSGSRRIWN